MHQDIAAIVAVAQNADATSTEIEAALAQAHAASADAEAVRAKADAAYQEGLIGLDDKALAKLATERTAAEVRRDRTRAIIAKLETGLADAQDREAEAARSAVYDAALAERDAAAARVQAEYPGLVAHLLDLLREMAEADVKVEAANKDLPVGAAKLATCEMVARHIPGQPREDIADTVLDLWCHEDEASPIAEEFQGRVRARGNGHGYYSTGTGQRDFVLRRFRRVSYRPAVPSQHIERLAVGLTLPPLRPGDPLAWQAEDWRTTGAGRTLHSLAAIEAAAAAPAEPRSRGVQVEFIPVSAPELLRREGETVEARARRLAGNVNARFEPVDVERDPDAASLAA